MLNDISSYRFMTHGMQHLPNSSDREEFQDTLRAMEIMGITHTDVKCKLLWQVILTMNTVPLIRSLGLDKNIHTFLLLA